MRWAKLVWRECSAVKRPVDCTVSRKHNSGIANGRCCDTEISHSVSGDECRTGSKAPGPFLRYQHNKSASYSPHLRHGPLPRCCQQQISSGTQTACQPGCSCADDTHPGLQPAANNECSPANLSLSCRPRFPNTSSDRATNESHVFLAGRHSQHEYESYRSRQPGKTRTSIGSADGFTNAVHTTAVCPEPCATSSTRTCVYFFIYRKSRQRQGRRHQN